MPRSTDGNQALIMQALRMAGVQVTDCHEQGHGFPDLACVYRNDVFLLEVKLPKCGLTPDERNWHERNQAATIGIVHSPEEALRFCGAIE